MLLTLRAIVDVDANLNLKKNKQLKHNTHKAKINISSLESLCCNRSNISAVFAAVKYDETGT